MSEGKMTFKWYESERAPVNEDLIVQIDTNVGVHFYLCTIDLDGDLINLEGDMVGWTIDEITRWGYLIDVTG